MNYFITELIEVIQLFIRSYKQLFLFFKQKGKNVGIFAFYLELKYSTRKVKLSQNSFLLLLNF